MNNILKWIVVMLLPLSISAQDDTDTVYSMVYYQKSLISKKDKYELYGYTSYDMYWANEIGLGLIITIPHSKRKKRINAYNQKSTKTNWRTIQRLADYNWGERTQTPLRVYIGSKNGKSN